MKAVAAFVLIAVTAVLMTGCKTGEKADQALNSTGEFLGTAFDETWAFFTLREDDPSYKYQDDMAKDIITPSRTAVENHNRRARTIILNNDQARDEVDKLLLFDRPFRNIDYPIE